MPDLSFDFLAFLHPIVVHKNTIGSTVGPTVSALEVVTSFGCFKTRAFGFSFRLSQEKWEPLFLGLSVSCGDRLASLFAFSGLGLVGLLTFALLLQ